MKKIIVLFLILFSTTACTKEKVIKKEKVEPKQKIVEKDTYKDNNTTPISLYKLEGNNLIKQTSITKHLSSMEDIDIFQVYPSNEDNIKVTSYSTDFYNEYTKYNINNNLKIGFQLEYTINNTEELSYLILNPTNAMEKWEYIMGYLYDDYLNKDKSFYSHIEEGEYTDNNLISSIKLQGGYQVDQITSNINLTVFTYDSEDDLLNNKYRGNSKYTLTIIPE